MSIIWLNLRCAVDIFIGDYDQLIAIALHNFVSY